MVGNFRSCKFSYKRPFNIRTARIVKLNLSFRMMHFNMKYTKITCYTVIKKGGESAMRSEFTKLMLLLAVYIHAALQLFSDSCS